jgi:hypothetical protein
MTEWLRDQPQSIEGVLPKDNRSARAYSVLCAQFKEGVKA